MIHSIILSEQLSVTVIKKKRKKPLGLVWAIIVWDFADLQEGVRKPVFIEKSFPVRFHHIRVFEQHSVGGDVWCGTLCTGGVNTVRMSQRDGHCPVP